MRLDDLVDAVAIVMNGRPAELVCIGEDILWGAELATGYTVRHWFTSADRDRKMLLLQIAKKTDFPDEAGEALNARFYLSKFILEGVTFQDQTDARGLGAAYLLDGIAVSLPSEEQWRVTSVRLDHMWLDEAGAERRRGVEVLNLIGRGQAEHVSQTFLNRTQLGLLSEPAALAARKEECFPHLSFGLDVDDHIAKLPAGMLAAVVKKLMLLDASARAWRRNPESTLPTLPGCRPESEPTMQQYGNHRIFRDGHGTNRTYELHCAAAAHRIHLRVVHELRGLEIGYIGGHLPTVKYD